MITIVIILVKMIRNIIQTIIDDIRVEYISNKLDILDIVKN
jgi:hypothetical protein